MSFEDILNQWEKETAKAYGKKQIIKDSHKQKISDTDSAKIKENDEKKAHPIDIWMRRNPIEDKDSDLFEEREQSPAQRRKHLRAMKPEAVIDLHGLTRDEAWSRLALFFADCTRQNLKKVLIIHGKGTHSEQGAVLRHMVTLFLEQEPHAGESGHAQKDSGGSGATWVLLK